jgi:uncharacterized protein (UPF0261 family)
MIKTVLIVCALDTKGAECLYLKELIEHAGIRVLTMDTGVLGEAQFQPTISSIEVAERAGVRLKDLRAEGNRGKAVEAMMIGSQTIASELQLAGNYDAIIGLGGSAGTSIGTAAMRMLPIGFPKIMISTIAAGNTLPYVGMSDITMMNSIIDIAGLNRITRKILSNAAKATVGMITVESPLSLEDDKPIIATTMFGVTTPCVEVAREHLERHGYEVVVFHATGIGGQAMESFIKSGMISGVLDVTTTELVDEVAGGLLSAGPERLEAAGLKGIPQVVSVGALDMANFGREESVPEANRTRLLYKHNPNVTLMRTNVQENQEVGELMALKLNRSHGKTAVYLPLKGVSSLDMQGQPFYGPFEDEALFTAIRSRLQAKVECIEMDIHINDESFALATQSRWSADYRCGCGCRHFREERGSRRHRHDHYL